jgi:hypothetical protein
MFKAEMGRVWSIGRQLAKHAVKWVTHGFVPNRSLIAQKGTAICRGRNAVACKQNHNNNQEMRSPANRITTMINSKQLPNPVLGGCAQIT